ncbi:MAG: YbjQ family protein [Gammaproteobacteria bacterium]|nr:YbjQ family protein [Gammaproteobacteria bacterium]MCY4342087.1 YbjQ family protein [Gammaproteobacteria bacterium]
MSVTLDKLVTTHAVPGRETREALGIVSAECVLGINIFRDVLGGLRDIVGGRSGTHQKALREARETCLNELADQASSLGADAVVGIDLDYSEISGGGKGMVLLVASGTAVRLK